MLWRRIGTKTDKIVWKSENAWERVFAVPCSPTLNWLVDKSMVAVPNTVRGRGGRDRQKYDEVQT